jgi:hypothetical protein
VEAVGEVVDGWLVHLSLWLLCLLPCLQLLAEELWFVGVCEAVSCLLFLAMGLELAPASMFARPLF